MLTTREPWQRTEASDGGAGPTKTVYLSLPDVCTQVFESVLDYMCSFHRSPSAELPLRDVSGEAALGALWLAGRLEMPELQELTVRRLQAAVTPQSAHAHLSGAMRLGLGKVRAAAVRLAAKGLGGTAVGAFDGLPLEIVEQVLGAAEEGGASRTGARDRVVASCLRAYDGRGRLDEEAYRRAGGG